MKKIITQIILGLILCFFTLNLSAQKRWAVDTLQADYSEFPNEKRAMSASYFNLKELANTIVIINSKIYKLDSKEFTDLKEEDILNLEIIKDENSKTDIKNIIIIKRKPDKS